MSKYKVKNKRRKKKGIVERYAALPEKKAPKGAGKRALALLGCAVFFLGFYISSMLLAKTEYYRFSIFVIGAYYLALPLLFAIFVILNRGLSNDIPTKEQLVDTMTEKEKEEYINEVQRCRKRARPLLVPIIPLALIVGFDLLFNGFFV